MIVLDERRFHWLVGLLEGEASFRLTPARRGVQNPQPLITVVMKDQDVIQQAAEIFQAGVTEIPPRKAHWSTEYLTKVQGARAYFLMQALQPQLGQRRQQQIQKALDGYRYVPNHVGSNNESARLNEAQVRQIKLRIAQGETAKQIARDFGVTHYTIWAIRSGKTWSHVTLDDSAASPLQTENLLHIRRSASDDENQHYWLAGLLEGEGSFLPPPPSAPNRPAIQIAMTDEDVLARAAELLGVSYHRWQRKNPQAKASFQAALRGRRAVELMKQLYPLMGQRRRQQIDRALAAYTPPGSRQYVNPAAKLTIEQVVVIKKRLKNGEPPQAIAADFGVSAYTVLDIRAGRTWRHVEI